MRMRAAGEALASAPPPPLVASAPPGDAAGSPVAALPSGEPLNGSRSIALAQEALDLGDDGARLARLGEVAVAPDLHRLLPVARQGVRGEGDDRDLVRRRVVLEHLRR